MPTKPKESPTAELDAVTLDFAEQVQWVADQAINLAEVVAIFSRDKLATTFARPGHDGTTDKAAAKLVGAMTALAFANTELLKAWVAREKEIRPESVGRGWN